MDEVSPQSGHRFEPQDGSVHNIPTQSHRPPMMAQSAPWVWRLFFKHLWQRKETKDDPHEYAQYVKHAVRMGNENYLRTLVPKQGSMCEVKEILQLAVYYKNPSILEYLIECGVNANEADKVGRTPLHIAAAIGSVPCTRVLLHYKADINAKNIWGRTPLMLAVINNFDSLTKFLVAEGADVNIPDNDGKVPIHILTSYGKIDMLKHFFDLPNINKQSQDRIGRSVISLASIARNERMLQFLFDSGCNISFEILNHFSPVHNVIAKYNFGCAKILFEGGAQVDFEIIYNVDGGKHSYTPLQLCLRQLYLINAMAHAIIVPHEKVRKGLAMLDLIIKVNGTNESVESLNKIINFSKAVAFSDYTNDFNRIIQKILLIGFFENKITQEQMIDFDMGDTLTLQNISRLYIRKRLMKTKRNVLWACDRLSLPDMLRRILLLEDI